MLLVVLITALATLAGASDGFDSMPTPFQAASLFAMSLLAWLGLPEGQRSLFKIMTRTRGISLTTTIRGRWNGYVVSTGRIGRDVA